MIVDPSAMEWRDAYKLMIGSILPRPIAWVSTISEDGMLNLAPYSFFTVVCANPMTICFSPMRKSNGGPKDTLVNIEATSEFVVNIVSERLARQMNATSADLPPEVDEFAMAGLATAPSASVRPPRVAEALVAYECQLLRVVHVGEEVAGAGALVLGTVKRLYLADEAVADGKIKLDVLQPIGRLAGNDYVRCTDTFTLERPR